MKKSILFLGAFLSFNFGFAQFLVTGTTTTDNKYRLGGIGLGFSTAPTFPASTKLMVNGNSFFNGNVGIGTLSPISKLQISTGDIKVDNGKVIIGTPFSTWSEGVRDWSIKADRGIAILAPAGSPDTAALIQIQNENVEGSLQLAHSAGDFYYSNQAKKGDVVLRANTPGSLILTNEGYGGGVNDIKFVTQNSAIESSSQVRMLINKDGNVGIGTGSAVLPSDTKLSVNGLIHTKEVQVDLNNWPDFVFKKEYKLPSLNEVEKQIQEKGHLVDIPSAEEVERNGVMLGDMNKKLLQKVEELTLYIIEMNKEIELLKANSKN